MTLFELIWAALAFGGLITGGFVGHAHFGVLGALVGSPVGLVSGLALCFLFSLVLAFVMKLSDRASRDHDV